MVVGHGHYGGVFGVWWRVVVCVKGAHRSRRVAVDVAVVKAISEGEKSIDTIAVACIDAESDTAIFPCGISRQRLAEFDTKKVIVVDKDGYKEYTFDEILPYNFKF